MFSPSTFAGETMDAVAFMVERQRGVERYPFLHEITADLITDTIRE